MFGPDVFRESPVGKSACVGRGYGLVAAHGGGGRGVVAAPVFLLVLSGPYVLHRVGCMANEGGGTGRQPACCSGCRRACGQGGPCGQREGPTRCCMRALILCIARCLHAHVCAPAPGSSDQGSAHGEGDGTGTGGVVEGGDAGAPAPPRRRFHDSFAPSQEGFVVRVLLAAVLPPPSDPRGRWPRGDALIVCTPARLTSPHPTPPCITPLHAVSEPSLCIPLARAAVPARTAVCVRPRRAPSPSHRPRDSPTPPRCAPPLGLSRPS
jgi:hypothetical protein